MTEPEQIIPSRRPPARAMGPLVLAALLFAAAAGGGAVSAVLVGGAPEAEAAGADQVRAQRFEVVDAAGRLRALPGVTDGPGLTLYDAAGKERAALVVFPGGSPGLSLFDAAGRARAMLWTNPDGTPGLTLYDAAGKERMGGGGT